MTIRSSTTLMKEGGRCLLSDVNIYRDPDSPDGRLFELRKPSEETLLNIAGHRSIGLWRIRRARR